METPVGLHERHRGPAERVRQIPGNETVPTAATGAGLVIEATSAAIKAQLGAANSER